MSISADAPDGRDLIRAYLPRTLVARWSAHPDDAPVWHEILTGSLMHCDMSGFTAMSERLAGRGKEGAELMAGVLNGFFDRMLRIADGWGGVQMKFGGDAMLLYFGGDEHAARAAACGLEMQRAMPEFHRVEVAGETYGFLMRAGIHSGDFFSASAGNPAGVLHYLLMGRDVSRSAATESEAQPGQVAASTEAAEVLRGSARLVQQGHVWQVRSIDAPERPRPSEENSGVPPRALYQYLLPPIAAPLLAGRAPHLAAEHRRVTAVFINLFGMAGIIEGEGPQAALTEIAAYLDMVLPSLDRHGGYLIGSDAAEDGDKLIAAFGAPIASERDEVSALRFALDLNRRLAASSLRLRHRIGINTGFVFAGEIGSPIRREYTVIGDNVNLSARLMAAAPVGRIYASAATIERARADFALRRLKPMRVKGKAAPVQAYELAGEGRAAPQQAEPDAVQLLGRDDEVAAMMRTAETVAASAAMRWCLVTGEPGIGKSALVDDIARRLTGAGWRRLAAACQAHLSRDVFAAWHGPLRQLFDGADDWAALRAAVERLAPEHAWFAGLVADIVSIDRPADPFIESMDPRTRRQQLVALVRAALAAEARRAPLLFTFDDAHHADEASLELLADVIAGIDAPVLLCVSSRATGSPGALSSMPAHLSLHLAELRPDDARRLAASVAGAAGADVDAVISRAQGNPLFVQELALSAAQSGEMPDSINEVIVARLDRLQTEEKLVLRAAAVTGTSFAPEHVGVLLRGRMGADAIDRALTGLATSGFIRGTDGEQAFRHGLAQEVVYDTLTFTDRRAMHHELARHIEEEDQGRLGAVAGLLLHHYDRAGDAPKTVVYAAMSGDRAAGVYANREAIDFYTRGLEALDRAGGGGGDRSILLERIGTCLETQGRHSAATEALQDALARWRDRGRRKRAALLDGPVPDAVREAHLCRRIAVTYERGSAYDEALSWLDRALAALPVRAGRVGSEVHASKSMTLYRKGEYREAIAWGRRALAVAKRVGDARAIAYAHNMLANSHIAEGSLRAAVRHLTEAVRLYDELEDVPGQAAANNNLGMCYHLMGELDAALLHYGLAGAADERVGDLVDKAVIDNNIGEVLLIQGRLDEADEHLARVLRAREANEELAAVAGLSCVNLCRIAMARGDLDAAERHARAGIRVLTDVGAKGLLTEAQIQRAELHLAQGDAAGALRQASAALHEATESGDRLLEARAQRIAALALAATGGGESAAIQLATSAALARRIGAGHEEARSLLALARLRVQSGGHPRADGVRRAVAILSRMGAAPELAQARALLPLLERPRT